MEDRTPKRCGLAGLAALLALCGPGCTPGLEALLRLANQNAGTTPFLDMLGESDLREPCDDWYCNDLCTSETEATLAGQVEATAPDVMMLEEVWDMSRCGDPDRPPEFQEPPYACSAGEGHQLTRVLPEGYSFACVHGERDSTTCIAFREAVFEPLSPSGEPADCDGRDCSALITDLESECEREGATAFLRGTTHLGPTTLAVAHLFVDFSAEDELCRAQQLSVLQEALVALPSDEVLVLAGDFNLDPLRWEGEDVDTLNELVEALDLERLPDDTISHLILDITIDLLFTRGWPGEDEARCELTFLDEGAVEPMLDHAFVACE